MEKSGRGRPARPSSRRPRMPPLPGPDRLPPLALLGLAALRGPSSLLAPSRARSTFPSRQGKPTHLKRFSGKSGSPPAQARDPPLPRSSARTELLSLSATYSVAPRAAPASAGASARPLGCAQEVVAAAEPLALRSYPLPLKFSARGGGGRARAAEFLCTRGARVRGRVTEDRFQRPTAVEPPLMKRHSRRALLPWGGAGAAATGLAPATPESTSYRQIWCCPAMATYRDRPPGSSARSQGLLSDCAGPRCPPR